MASIREGNQSVLMVVDVQVDVLNNAHAAEPTIANVARTVERARAAGVPVIWVQHNDDDFVLNSPGWQWVPELTQAPGELLIHKQFNSAFEATTLDAELARLGATRIVLAGAATNWCIRATAYAALERGYDLTLVRDAHTTKSQVLEDGSLLDAATLIQDLNNAMNWLAYPGRKNTTATAEDVSFAAAS